MFSTIEHILTADVAQNGTFTVGYPAGTDADVFNNGVGHYMEALGATRTAPNDITVAFGASEITITHLGATTLPAGSQVFVNLEMVGTRQSFSPSGQKALWNTTALTVHRVNFGSPLEQDVDALIAAATGAELPNAATVTHTFNGETSTTSPVDGALSTGILDVPRNIIAAQVGTSVAGSVTVTGEDVYGESLVETLTFAGSVSNEAETGVKAFAKVTSIAITSATDMTSISLNVGIGSRLGLPFYLPSSDFVLAAWEDGERVDIGPKLVRVPFYITPTEYGAGTSVWVPIPVSGQVIGIETVVDAATTGAQTVTAEIQTTAVTGLSVTIAGSSAAGTRDSDYVADDVATGRIEAGEVVEINITNTPSAGSASGFIVVKPDGPDDASFVAGASVAATATSGDIRGTWTPGTTLEPATGFELDVFLPEDPDLRLGQQYAG